MIGARGSETHQWVGRRPGDTALGVDPGMANTGLSVVRRTLQGGYVIEQTALVQSTPGKKAVRKADDDFRRLELIHKALQELIGRWSPQVIAIETYTPLMGMQGGSAWKTSMVYGMVMGVAISNSRRVVSQTPKDIKAAFTLGKAKGKGDVQAMLLRLVPGLQEHLGKVCAGKREHMADATAHAMLALDRLKAGK
jgi:Holliday junction resolvasome RuvABC endonuclease subunit